MSQNNTLNDTHSLSHTKWNCKYHVVFAPKYRRKVFYEEKRLEVGGIGLASALAWMMGESQHRRLSKLRTQVDHKLRSKIEEKKRAHGLKTDGSVQEYDPEQSL